MPDTYQAQGSRVLPWGRIAPFVFLAVACVLAYWLTRTSPVVQGPNEGLVVDDNELSFGEAWENTKFRWKVTVKNPTSKDVSIVDFSASCGCIELKPKKLVVRAGTSEQLTFELDLSRATPDPVSLARKFSAPISPVFLNGRTGELPWVLSGFVKESFSLNPREVNLGDIHVSKQPIGPMTIAARSNIPVSEIKVSVPVHRMTAYVRPSAAKHGESEIIINYTSALPVGNTRDIIVIKPIAKDSDVVLPAWRIPVIGRITTDYVPNPHMVLFGLREIGKSFTEHVVIRSIRSTPFSIERVACSEASQQAELVNGKNDVEATIRITQRIEQTGEQFGTITAILRTHENNVVQVPILVKYFGTKLSGE